MQPRNTQSKDVVLRNHSHIPDWDKNVFRGTGDREAPGFFAVMLTVKDNRIRTGAGMHTGLVYGTDMYDACGQAIRFIGDPSAEVTSVSKVMGRMTSAITLTDSITIDFIHLPKSGHMAYDGDVAKPLTANVVIDDNANMDSLPGPESIRCTNIVFDGNIANVPTND